MPDPPDSGRFGVARASQAVEREHCVEMFGAKLWTIFSADLLRHALSCTLCLLFETDSDCGGKLLRRELFGRNWFWSGAGPVDHGTPERLLRIAFS